MLILTPRNDIDEGDLESLSFNIPRTSTSVEDVGFGLRSIETVPPLRMYTMGQKVKRQPAPPSCPTTRLTTFIVNWRIYGTIYFPKCDTDCTSIIYDPQSVDFTKS